MMSEWWTYRLSDLILFSSHTYYRLIELYNAAIWPLQVLAILFAIALLYLAVKRPNNNGRFIAVILGLGWLWVAWAFHWQRFQNIHWVASYYAFAFVAQAVLLIWAGVIKNAMTINPLSHYHYRTGVVLLTYVSFIQPLLTILAGHGWKQVELFAITPEPTVAATVGILLMINTRKYWWLTVLPVLWCVISTPTLWVLQSVNALTMLITGLLAILGAIWNRKHKLQ